MEDLPISLMERTALLVKLDHCKRMVDETIHSQVPNRKMPLKAYAYLVEAGESLAKARQLVVEQPTTDNRRIAAQQP